MFDELKSPVIKPTAKVAIPRDKKTAIVWMNVHFGFGTGPLISRERIGISGFESSF